MPRLRQLQAGRRRIDDIGKDAAYLAGESQESAQALHERKLALYIRLANERPAQ